MVQCNTMTIFNKEFADQIIEEITNGRSLASICEDEGMPHRVTVLNWIAKGRQQEGTEYADFAERYELAQELRSEVYADKIIELSEQQVPDEVIEKGNAAIHAWSNRQKLMADNIKWVSSRLLSKRYGDKIQHTGEDGGPIVTRIERVIVDEKNTQPTDTHSADI